MDGILSTAHIELHKVNGKIRLKDLPDLAVLGEGTLNINVTKQLDATRLLVVNGRAVVPESPFELDAIERAYFMQGLDLLK
jgi:hypothetical protein